MDTTIYILILVILLIGYYVGKSYILNKRKKIDPDSEEVYSEDTTKNNLNPVTIETQEFDYQYFDEATDHTNENDFSGYSPHSEIEEKIQMLIHNAHALDNNDHREQALSYLEDAHNIMVKNLLSTRRINQFYEIITYYKDNEDVSLTEATNIIEEKYEKASIQEIFGTTEETNTNTVPEVEKEAEASTDWLEQEADKIRNSNEDDSDNVEDLLKQVIKPEQEKVEHPSIEDLMENIHKEASVNKEDKEIDYEKELLENLNTTEDLENTKKSFDSNKDVLGKVSDAIIDLNEEVKKKK